MVSTSIFESISMIFIDLIFIITASIFEKKCKKRKFSRLSPIFRFLLAAFIVLFPATAAWDYSVIIGWDPNDEPDLEGYVVYISAESPCPPYDEIDNYPESELADPLNPMVKITDLEIDVRYYFVVTAYNTSGNESDYSRTLSVLNAKGENAIGSSGKGSSGGGGGGGGG